MTPAVEFALGAVLVVNAALFLACAIGSLAGWWAGVRDRGERS